MTPREGEQPQNRRLQVEPDYLSAIEQLDHEAAHRLGAVLGLTPTAINDHMNAFRTNPEGRLPADFHDYAALAPGRFDIRVFDQSEIWVDNLRRPHHIRNRTDFTDEHLLAVLAYLKNDPSQWALHLYQGSLLTLVQKLASSPNDQQRVLWKIVAATPLVKALLEEVRHRRLVSAHIDLA